MGFLSGILGTKNTFGEADNPLEHAQLDHADFGGAMGQGLQGQGDARNQQSVLAQMLMQQAQGGGPNPAALQLQQGTEANARMAASQMASQRGLNPALAARGVMDQTANLNQQAAGQAGVMRAQQQLAAQQQLGGVLGQQRGQDLGLYGQAAQGQQGQNALGLQQAQGNNQIRAGVAQGNANTNAGIVGGVLGGIGAAMGKPPGLAGGGQVQDPFQAGISALVGAGLRKGYNAIGDAVSTLASGGMVPGDSPKNDVVPARLSPGEIVLPRSVAMAEDAPERAAAFVRAIRRRKEAAQGPGYGKVLAAYRGGRVAPC